ncbi:MAG: hypothetical protein R3240_14320, partial [Gammaproteobacteria bacterium]|nr:hypothetical protein [Gammaproteobacteria bacterium]
LVTSKIPHQKYTNVASPDISPNDNLQFVEFQEKINDFQAQLVAVKNEISQSRQLTKLNDTVQVTRNETTNDNAVVAKEASIKEASSVDNEPVSVEDNQLERILSMDAKMSQLEFDPGWESNATSQISNEFAAGQLSGTNLQAVECHGIMCRIELHHDDEDAFEQAYQNPLQIVPWNHRGRIEKIEDENGNIVSFYYITKEGYNFPKS